MSSFLLLLFGFLYVVLCLFLILVILIQPAKAGGGLGGLGGGSAGGAIADSLGATEGEKTLSKYTSYGIAVFFFLTLFLTFLINAKSNESPLELESEGAPAVTVDTAPAEAGTANTPPAAPEGQ